MPLPTPPHATPPCPALQAALGSTPTATTPCSTPPQAPRPTSTSPPAAGLAQGVTRWVRASRGAWGGGWRRCGPRRLRVRAKVSAADEGARGRSRRRTLRRPPPHHTATPNRLRAALTARTARLCGSWRASGTSTWMRVREERSGGSAVGSRGQQAQRAMAGRRRQGGAWQGGSATSRCSPHPPLQSSATKTATQWRAQSRCGCGRCAAPRASRARACPCLAAAAAPRPRRHGWHAAAARPGSAAHPALPPAPLVSLPPAPQCREKPADDPYQFTHFCHELNSCTGGINPLPSDSRRRPDRALLELGNSSGARRAAGLGRSRGGVWRAAAVAAARVARGAPRPTRPAAHPHRLLRLCRGQVQP